MILSNSQMVSVNEAQSTDGVAVELTIERILATFREASAINYTEPDWGTLWLSVMPSGGDILVVSASVGEPDE